MLTDDQRTLATSALRRVMEEAAYVFVEPPSGSVEWDGPAYRGVAPFSGSASGEVELTLPEAVAEALAAEMVGEDGEPGGGATAADVTGEIANMIAGVIEHEWPGKPPHDRWEIGVPVVTLSDAADLFDPSDEAVTLCTEEEQPIRIAVRVHPRT